MACTFYYELIVPYFDRGLEVIGSEAFGPKRQDQSL
jgi:hypothetical protein